MMSAEAVSVWNLAAELGEGPIWIDGALWFVDIKRHKVYRFNPASDERRSWDAPEQVGFIVPRASGGLIAGLASGLFAFDPESGAFERIVAVDEETPSNRLNDGVVDPAGRLWFGTMDNGERGKTGAFYCYAGGQLRTTGLTDIAITNGPAVSPDGRTLYWVDTLERTISAAPIRDDGSLAPSRPFAAIPEGAGNPDGPSVDSEGCVWIALYGGWEARRYSPSGDLVASVPFPAANITKVAFGGPDLRTAYATSAAQKLSPEALAEQPQAGDLFEFHPGVAGLPSYGVRD